MPITLNGTTGITTPGVTNSGSETVTNTSTVGALTVNGNNISAVNSLGFRNRIINGAMVIDQRNAGASVTPTVDPTYTLDRWFAGLSASSKFSVQQSSTAPSGFSNSLFVTSLAATSVAAGDYYLISQRIEGFNCADFAWGTASAQAVTLSFWVRSSLTGTFGGSLRNSAANRSYPFTYTISAANTWEQKTLTISGDTSGTWLTTNGVGITLSFGLGVGSTFSGTAGAWSGSNLISATGATSVVGTNGATWYITGVQLEAGSVATPFEARDYGRELIMCQRYYEKSYNIDVAPGTNSTAGRFESSGASDQASNQIATIRFAVAKRAAPTMSGWTSTGTSGSWDYGRSGASGAVTVNFAYTSTFSFSPYVGVGTGWVPSTMIGHWVASAEL